MKSKLTKHKFALAIITFFQVMFLFVSSNASAGNKLSYVFYFQPHLIDYVQQPGRKFTAFGALGANMLFFCPNDKDKFGEFEVFGKIIDQSSYSVKIKKSVSVTVELPFTCPHENEATIRFKLWFSKTDSNWDAERIEHDFNNVKPGTYFIDYDEKTGKVFFD